MSVSDRFDSAVALLADRIRDRALSHCLGIPSDISAATVSSRTTGPLGTRLEKGWARFLARRQTRCKLVAQLDNTRSPSFARLRASQSVAPIVARDCLDQFAGGHAREHRYGKLGTTRSRWSVEKSSFSRVVQKPNSWIKSSRTWV